MSHREPLTPTNSSVPLAFLHATSQVRQQLVHFFKRLDLDKDVTDVRLTGTDSLLDTLSNAFALANRQKRIDSDIQPNYELSAISADEAFTRAIDFGIALSDLARPVFDVRGCERGRSRFGRAKLKEMNSQLANRNA